MDNWIDEAFQAYINFTNSCTLCKKVDNDWFVIVTPFFNQINDSIEIYCKKINNNAVKFSDDSVTIHDLLTTLPKFFSDPYLTELFDNILLNHDLKKDDNELCATAPLNQFTFTLQKFTAALITISSIVLALDCIKNKN